MNDTKPFPIFRRTLIILVGPSGSGKTTFSKKFPFNMVVSTDFCRALVSDSPSNQIVSEDAFDLFYFILRKRLKNGFPAIADSTALKPIYREKLKAIAKEYNFNTLLILFDIPKEICIKNAQERSWDLKTYKVGEDVINKQFKLLEIAREEIKREGYDKIIVFKRLEEISNFKYRWTLPEVEMNYNGKLDIIGDIHGCFYELIELLTKLKYISLKKEDFIKNFNYIFTNIILKLKDNQLKDEEWNKDMFNNIFSNNNRKIVFLGDIMDKGVHNLKVFEIVYTLWKLKKAFYVPGNHCFKLYRYLTGRNVNINYGLEKTIEELEKLELSLKKVYINLFIELYKNSVPYLIFYNGELLVSHAGIWSKLIGKDINKKVWSACLYGPGARSISPTEIIRSKKWIKEFKDSYMKVVYGHIPVEEAKWEGNTLDIDLGAVFGGHLAALRYPENIIIKIKSFKKYAEKDNIIVRIEE